MSQSLRTAGLRPPWQPGQSGNIVGAKGLRRVLAMARKGSPEAVETIQACIRDPEAPWPSRLAAAFWLVERAWGKAKEVHEFNGAEGVTVVVLTGVPDPDSQQQPVTDETSFTIEYEGGDE